MFPQWLIQIVGALLIIGVLLWALSQVTFIDEGVKRIIRIILIVLIAIWLIYIFMGILGGGGSGADLDVHTHRGLFRN